MRIGLEIEIHVDGASTPLPEDVMLAIRKTLREVPLAWYDPSLDHDFTATMTVDGVWPVST